MVARESGLVAWPDCRPWSLSSAALVCDYPERQPCASPAGPDAVRWAKMDGPTTHVSLLIEENAVFERHGGS